VLFSSDIDDIALQNCTGHRSVLFAVRLRIVYMFVCLSRTGNYNGFDLIVPWVLFLSIGVWRFLCNVVVFCIVFFSDRLFSELLKYLRIERHLAAKTGTNFAVLI